MANKRCPVRLGLTGGIGSGKSTVGGMFASLGAAMIDADQIARALTGRKWIRSSQPSRKRSHNSQHA